jgi:hypothetical protein
MQLFSVLIPLALASGALSHVLGRSTQDPTSTPKSDSDCLSKSEATVIVNDFINLLTNTQSNFNTTLANQLLADDFTDRSDSIDYLLEAPVRWTSVIFTSPSRVCVICVQPSFALSKLPTV